MAAKEAVILTPAVAAVARGSANSHPERREGAAFFAVATC